MNQGLRNECVFAIPRSGVGEVIVTLPLRWAWVEERLQAVIDMKGVVYPEMRFLTRDELDELLECYGR